MSKKILLVVEGRKAEPKLMRCLLNTYELGIDYEIVPYKTNIHVLYDDIFADDEDAEMLSLQNVLKERENNPEKRAVLDQAFSDILLIFDYDPQDDKFDPAHLVEMQEHFNESTDEGKLYINYPMVEACRHFRDLPDPGYFLRTIDKENGIPGYKELVGQESCCVHPGDLAKEEFDCILAMTLEKILQVCEKDYDPLQLDRAYPEADPLDLLHRQNERLAQSQEIWVLGTCLLFICDFSTGLVDFNAKPFEPTDDRKGALLDGIQLE